MSFKTIVSLIDDCIEEGQSLAIICNNQLCQIFKEYLATYEMKESFNISHKISTANLDLMIIINCKEENYEYIIDFLPKLKLAFDQVIAIGDYKFDDLNRFQSKRKSIYFDIEITKEDLDYIKSIADELKDEDAEYEDDYEAIDRQHQAELDKEFGNKQFDKANDRLVSVDLDKEEFVKEIRKSIPENMDELFKARMSLVMWYHSKIMNIKMNHNDMYPQELLDLLVEMAEEFETNGIKAGIDLGIDMHKDYMMNCLCGDSLSGDKDGICSCNGMCNENCEGECTCDCEDELLG